MDDRFSILSQQVFNKSLPEFSVNELVAITDQNPYFTAAQILLLKKLEKGSEAYNSQYQKAILYYHDPVAFDYLIHRSEFETDIHTQVETPIEETIGESEILNEPLHENSELPVVNTETAETNSYDEVENYMDEMRSGSSIEEEEKIHIEKSEQIQLNEIIEELSLDEKIDSEDDLYEDEQIEIISENKEAVIESNSSEPETFILEQDQFVQEPENSEHNLKLDQDKQSEETEPVHLSGIDQNINEPTEDLKVSHIPSLPPLKEEKETDLLFEPFHTVDYFASQGIKVSQEEVPKDKFGKQLKSFTEWLKTMKRLPAAEIASSVEKSSEQKIENLAAVSVNNADVVTEAMAEVWIRQGNQQKAIEIYNKLILLNPSKSAYFAAKIDSLKKFD